MWQIWII